MAEEDQQTFQFKAVDKQGQELDTIQDYNGYVKIEYSNGDKFQGDLENGQRIGKGKYIYQNGNIYEGLFSNNKINGIGKLKFAKGGYYYGNFKENQKNGEGVYVYPNNDRYSGFWKDGKKDGEGVYIRDENNMKLKGTWQQGQFLNGKWILENGKFYEGKFENNLPKGEGFWVNQKGEKVKGIYEQQQRQSEKFEVPHVLNDIYNLKQLDLESIWKPLYNYQLKIYKI